MYEALGTYCLSRFQIVEELEDGSVRILEHVPEIETEIRQDVKLEEATQIHM